MLRLLFEKIQFIHFYPLELAHGRSLIHILDKFTEGTIHSMSNGNLAQKHFEFQAWVKKCHFGYFS
jgi:hypothetical protein